MLPIRSMVLSKSNPWNMLVIEVLPELRLVEDLRVVLPHVLGGGYQEAGGAAGRIADHVARRRRRHLDH